MGHVGRLVEDEMRFDDVLVAEREKVGGGFVHCVVPKVFGNVCHGSLFSHVFIGFAWHFGQKPVCVGVAYRTFVFVRFRLNLSRLWCGFARNTRETLNSVVFLSEHVR